MKIIQFGEGNFLRTFVDAYFDALNKEGLGDYEVAIVKPIPYGSLEQFAKQGNRYHIVLRGVVNGKALEEVREISSVKKAINPFSDPESFYDLALDPEVKLVVSNTTEAGICFQKKDKRGGFAEISYPAKLTKWLYERFRAGLPGLYLLPVELIDNNADELRRCVNAYIDLWDLGEGFRNWNRTQNFYCNTLVDRIVSGFPRDEKTKEHLWKLIGEEDLLVSVGEPFGLWAIEDKGEISSLIHEGHHNIDVVLTKDIAYYKKRKVRVLNGSHTNLVPISLWKGKTTVYEVMTDERLSAFVDQTLKNEIVPYVSEEREKTMAFALEVRSRFLNPFLNHLLTSIALNSVSKWRARCLPSYLDYYYENGSLPPLLTLGLAYLIAIYRRIEKVGEKHFCHLPCFDIEVKDEERYLDYFSNGKSIADFLSDEGAWGMNLASLPGLLEKVSSLVETIEHGEEAL